MMKISSSITTNSLKRGTAFDVVVVLWETDIDAQVFTNGKRIHVQTL
jgi:hypothetical protein